MMDHIALLNLYREWGVDEALVSLCTNHLENVKQTVHKSPIKQNFRKKIYPFNCKMQLI